MTESPPVSLTHALATPLVPVTGEKRLLYTLLELQGEQVKNTLPVNIGLIIDGSDSMRIRLVTDQQFAQLARSGQAREVMTDGVPAYQITAVTNDIIKQYPRRLDYVSEALRIAGEFLRPIDRFAVTAFADEALTLIPSSSGTERTRLRQAARELEYLSLGEGTNIAAGLASAFSEIHPHQNQKFANRLILLTDGHTRNVDECYNWARRARDNRLPLTTMGVGSEFNEDLLIPLAEITGGNAYYIESPDQIPDAFRKELGVAFRISLRDLNLHLHLMNGVVLRNTYRVAPELGSIVREKKTNGHHTFPLGDYDPAMPVALLLEFIIPGWDIGVHTIASTHLSWQDPDKQVSTTNSSQDIQVQIVGAPKTEENQRVLNLVERVGAYKFGMRALEIAREGAEREDATMRLRQASTRLHELGEHTLADHLSLQADLLKKTGSLDPDITKKMRYQTRHLVRNVPDPPQDIIGQ